MSDDYSFDFTTVEANTGYEPAPRGIYTYNVTEPKASETRDGNPMLTVTLVSTEEINGRQIKFTERFAAFHAGAHEYVRGRFKNFAESLETDSGQPVITDFSNLNPATLAGDDDEPSPIAGAIVSADTQLRTWGKKDEEKADEKGSTYRPLMNPKTKQYNVLGVFLPTKRSLAGSAPTRGGRSRRP